MPYVYVEPEVFWFNNDFEIFKTYDNDDYNCPFEYWFTLDSATCGKESHYEFDIREFEEYDSWLSIKENLDILTNLGYITKEGWKYNKQDELTKHLL